MSIQSQVIVPEFYTAQVKLTSKLRQQSKREEIKLQKKREAWVLAPPSNITLTLRKDAGTIPAGLVLSVPHEAGRHLLHRRLAKIIEHDVTVDAVLDGEIEDISRGYGSVSKLICTSRCRTWSRMCDA